MPIPATITDRINLGIAWLDENAPAWREAINLDTLNLFSGRDCVLGQVFYAEAAWGDYADGYQYVLESGRLTVAWMVDHAFEDDGCDYPRLTAAWRTALTAARTAEYWD